MKKISKLLLVLLSILLIPNVYAAASKYESVVSTDGKIKNGEFYITIGYTGEDILDLEVKLAYDTDYLELSGIYPLNDYVQDLKDVDASGSWEVKKIETFKNDDAYENNYAMVVFKLKDKFRVGKAVDVFLYDQVATGTDEYNYKDKAKLLSLRRAATGEMTLLIKNVDKKIKMEYWVMDHILLFVLFFIIIVAVIAVIFIIPSKRIHESRSKKISLNKETVSKKRDYKIEHEEDAEEYKIDVDAFNGNGAKNDYNVENSNPEFVNDSKAAFKDSDGLGIINPKDFSNKDEK